jgi:hypothetical protein
VQPFRAQYYVDPTFAGVQTGSASNPFTTIAAAFAMGALLAQTSGVVIVPANASINENVVFPTSGSWEITNAMSRWPNAANARINGTVTINTTAAAQHAMTGLSVAGAVSGNAGAATRVDNTRCQFSSTYTLTNTAGTLRTFFTSEGPTVVGANGNTVGATSVAGSVVARGWHFTGLVTMGSALVTDSEFNTCLVDTGFASAAPGQFTLRLIDVLSPGSGLSFTAVTGTLQVQTGAATTAFLTVAVPVVGPGVSLVPLIGNQAARTLLAGNIGSVPLVNAYPACLITVEATLTLLVPGTVGAAQMALSYVDLIGVARLTPFGGPLNIAGAAGTEISAVLPISQNGSGVTLNISGVVTPGALSMSLGANARVAR